MFHLDAITNENNKDYNQKMFYNIQKMFHLDAITNENNKDYNKKWSYILDHPYRMLMVGGSGSGKTNPLLLNLIKEQESDNLIDKIYLYAKYLSEPKYQFLIKKREDVEIKHLKDPKAFIEYSQCMDNVYNSIDDCNPNRKIKNLILFGEMIADAMTNKKFQAIVKELLLDAGIEYISCFYYTILFFCSKRS